jgi:hypothetical protein
MDLYFLGGFSVVLCGINSNIITEGQMSCTTDTEKHIRPLLRILDVKPLVVVGEVLVMFATVCRLKIYSCYIFIYTIVLENFGDRLISTSIKR